MRRNKTGARWLVYRFWADPRGEITPELWRTALDMQRFWNRLVALREDVAFNSETLPQDAETILTQFWNLLTGGNADCKRWRKELKEEWGLNWEARDAVFDRFVTCCEQAAKNRRGWPKFQHRLERVAIPHRFKNGGVSPEALFTRVGRRAWRFGLEPVPQWTYQGKSRNHTNARLTKGFFGLSKQAKIEFVTVLHRAFPSQGIVKGVTWLGELHPVKSWQWAIAITLESASSPPARPTLPACGLDLGWRAMGDYIRIGMLYDSDGNVDGPDYGRHVGKRETLLNLQAAASPSRGCNGAGLAACQDAPRGIGAVASQPRKGWDRARSAGPAPFMARGERSLAR